MKQVPRIAIVPVLLLLGVGVWWFLIQKTEPVADDPNPQPPATEQTAVLEPRLNPVEAMYSSMEGDVYDKAYLADMITLHQGSLTMASQAKFQTKKPEIGVLAEEIMATQVPEVQQMMRWQEQWQYLVIDPNDPHAGHIREMANALSDEMAAMAKALDGLSGSAYEKEFLKQMIMHHQKVLDMSKYAETNARHQEIKDLARIIHTSQQKELSDMQRWQKEWGY